MARPTKITAAVVRKLEKSFEDGLSVTEACGVSGISRDIYYKHYRDDPEFSYKMDRSINALSSKARAVVAKAIKDGDLKTAKWFLDKVDAKGEEPFDEKQIEHDLKSLQERFDGVLGRSRVVRERRMAALNASKE